MSHTNFLQLCLATRRHLSSAPTPWLLSSDLEPLRTSGLSLLRVSVLSSILQLCIRAILLLLCSHQFLPLRYSILEWRVSVVSATPSLPSDFTSPMLSQPEAKGFSDPISTARPCLIGQPLKFQRKHFNFSSSWAARGIAPGVLAFGAAVKIKAPVEPPRSTALCVSNKNIRDIAVAVLSEAHEAKLKYCLSAVSSFQMSSAHLLNAPRSQS